jgi:hypothetical protein
MSLASCTETRYILFIESTNGKQAMNNALHSASRAYYAARSDLAIMFSEYDADRIAYRNNTPTEARAIAETEQIKRAAVAKRIATERRVVRRFIRIAKAAGFDVHSVHNGEERIKVAGEAEAMEHVFSVDDSRVAFMKRDEPGRARETLVVVLGNGCECLGDMSEGRADWDAVVKAAMDYADTQYE